MFAAEPPGDLTTVFSSSEWKFRGGSHNAAGKLYIIGWSTTVLTLDLDAVATAESKDFGPGRQLCDLAFRPSEPPPPEIPGTWVMPYDLSAFRVDQLDADGLVDYGGIVDAPFGGQLGFRFDSSNEVPTSSAFYYRLSYRRQGSNPGPTSTPRSSSTTSRTGRADASLPAGPARLARLAPWPSRDLQPGCRTATK